jgi:hypothetical protein
MDAFESLVSALLAKEGYWTRTGFKVELTKADKRTIGRPTSPRWEMDVIAYKGKGNEVLAIECKSYPDSVGVQYAGVSGENEEDGKRYKLFDDPTLRRIVLQRLGKQLLMSGACPRMPKVTLCLAVGKVKSPTDRENIKKLFKRKGWRLYDDVWIGKRLAGAASSAYEDNIATISAKILLRRGLEPPGT